jgi:Protein of unknown function (DUF2997)
MGKPKTLEILISADGERMLVTAHNFKGKECEAAVKAFSRGGEVIQSGPTAEYYQREEKDKHLTQGR